MLFNTSTYETFISWWLDNDPASYTSDQHETSSAGRGTFFIYGVVMFNDGQSSKMLEQHLAQYLYMLGGQEGYHHI